MDVDPDGWCVMMVGGNGEKQGIKSNEMEDAGGWCIRWSHTLISFGWAEGRWGQRRIPATNSEWGTLTIAGKGRWRNTPFVR